MEPFSGPYKPTVSFSFCQVKHPINFHIFGAKTFYGKDYSFMTIIIILLANLLINMWSAYGSADSLPL